MPAPLDSVTTIQLSDKERDSGHLSDVNMYDAVDAFFRDGVVVLGNAIPVDLIDRLNERMLKDTDRILQGGLKVNWNQGIEKGNVSQRPPLEKDWLLPEVYANKAVMAVMTNVWGPSMELRYVQSNTLIRGAKERQEVHRDQKANHILHHPGGMVVNTCLIDTGPDSGSTELWLGTHISSQWGDYKDDPKLGRIADASLEARRKVRPPVHPTLRKGSVVLRDLRVWHAGMPNPSQNTRIMLALCYHPGWFKNQAVPKYPASLEPHLAALETQNPGYKFPAQFLGDTLETLEYEGRANFYSPLYPDARAEYVS